MKYKHILQNDKFINSYIEFIEKNFDIKDHMFYIVGGISEKKIPILERENIKKILLENMLIKGLYFFYRIKFLQKMLLEDKETEEKIYFHGLFGKDKILFLFIFRKYLKKSNWIIWGGDLYCYRNRKKGFLRKIYYKIEEYVKGNFSGYITQIKGDYELAQKWYGAKGKYYNCFMYPSNLYKNLEIKEIEKEYIAIQIGNSADPSNNHFEIFKKLENYKNEDIKIYCPLSYGDKIYADKVIKKGKEIFEEKFIAMIEFLEYQKYLEFLSQIDIAIFAHDRQQAVGNITSLLSMKKTVYLKEEVTTYKLLEELGVKVKSFNNLKRLEVFEDEVLEKNKEIIKERFSEKRLIEDWKKIFED